MALSGMASGLLPASCVFSLTVVAAACHISSENICVCEAGLASCLEDDSARLGVVLLLKSIRLMHLIFTKLPEA